MLSNFQLETHALLQSFLVGQPEFRQTMQSPHMLQLRQRVIAACHIGPMDQDETRGYIEHRLTKVGWKGNPKFEADAYEAVYRATGGIPRSINSVCDRVLLSGYLAGKEVFGREDVDDVAREISEEAFGDTPSDSANSASTNGSGEVRATHPRMANLPLALDGRLDDQTTGDASRLIAELQSRGFEERLARLERQASTTLGLLQQVLVEVRTRGRNGVQ